MLQSALLKLGLYEGAVHGTYDVPTDRAVRDFQRGYPRYGLEVDGDAGENTLRGLFNETYSMFDR